MENSTPAIIFENIEKNFGSLKVLKGITGEINRGEVVAVIGSSGCGKSTLLRCFNRLETINGGRLVVNDIPLHQSNFNYKQLRQLRTQVGMVFQQFNLFPHLSVLENLTLAQRKVLGLSSKESVQTARLYLEKVGLFDKVSAYPEQLSGGQKQRGSHRPEFMYEPPDHAIRRTNQRFRSGTCRRSIASDAAISSRRYDNGGCHP